MNNAERRPLRAITRNQLDLLALGLNLGVRSLDQHCLDAPAHLEHLHAWAKSAGVAPEAALWLRQTYGRPCSPATVRSWVHRSARVREARDRARETRVDYAETTMHRLVCVGHFPAVEYILSTLGKDRGYGTRVEQSGIGGRPIEHEHGFDLSKLPPGDAEKLLEMLTTMSPATAPAIEDGED